MIKVKDHLAILGKGVIDKVTGFKGVAVSVSFDLYGCIQVVINPGMSDGKLGESQWFDIARLRIVEHVPVMNVPDYEFGDIADGNHGPAEKPRVMTKS